MERFQCGLVALRGGVRSEVKVTSRVRTEEVVRGAGVGEAFCPEECPSPPPPPPQPVAVIVSLWPY